MYKKVINYMKILFCKITNKRRKEFQIKTSIIKNGSVIEVWKEPLCIEGVNHIKRMVQNQKALSNIYGNAVSDYRYDGWKIITPFYNEKSNLAEKLYESIEKDDIDEIKIYVKLIRDLIIGNQNNLCKFCVTNSFKKIFGDAQIDNCNAVKIANIDIQPDNILFIDDSNIKIIDYEWVFDFPVPVEFILYYSLKAFVLLHIPNISIENLCEIAGINKSLVTVYENMINSFLDYICIDKEKKIDFRNMGKFMQNELEIEGYLHKLRFNFPKDILKEGDKIILYGAGSVGIDYAAYLNMDKKYKFVAWADKEAKKLKKGNIISPDQIIEFDFDKIVIAVLHEKMANEIKNELINIGITKEKIIWKSPI